jgi:hypothetical protein
MVDYRPSIQWFDGPVRDRLPPARPIDLYSESALRAWGTTDAQSSSFTIQVHHAACDGKAVLQVLDEFLRNYAHAVDGKSRLKLPPRDFDALRRRGTFGLTVGKTLRMLPAQLSALFAVREFLMRQPVPLLETTGATAAISGELPASYPDVHYGRLNADEVRKLSAAAAACNVTVNDLLLRDFFVAVNDFRTRHQAVAAGEWIRFSVPINLRPAGGSPMSAVNAVSMLFLDRRPAQIADPAGLLRSIHKQMALMRRRQWGLTLIWSLHVLRLLPGGIAKRVDSGRCEVTCVLSNLGRAMIDSPLPRRDERIVAGNLLLDNIDFFTPVRDGTAVTVALVFYAGALQMCMQYDSRRVSDAQADDLMATYLGRIRLSLESARSVEVKTA